LSSCFSSLLDTLSKQSPETVKQVQLFVKELRRITILWDEKWLMALQQIYGEYAKRFQNFDNEIQKATGDKSAFEEKYGLLQKPILYVLERLLEFTSRYPETANEKLFQERFGDLIDGLIEDFKKPFNPEAPLDAWSKFKQFYAVMQHRSQKRISYTLKMNDISPVLANLKNTMISMPGNEPGTQSGSVYIKSVDNMVLILPTKTKPKKLAFYGSDGKRYTYLFKGLEDLHLDERIMQFLSIANLMMKRSVDCDGRSTYYRAHHYSVIPLGPTSGLISWVDGVTPIFSMYKKWQQREAANPKKDGTSVIMRPSEIYYK
jgi:PI-3-kinase-related kinase SMG-1